MHFAEAGQEWEDMVMRLPASPATRDGDKPPWSAESLRFEYCKGVDDGKAMAIVNLDMARDELARAQEELQRLGGGRVFLDAAWCATKLRDCRKEGSAHDTLMSLQRCLG